MLYDVLVVHIIDLDIAMRVVLPSFCLLVIKTQCGDNVCYARFSERLRPPQGEYSFVGSAEIPQI